MSCYTNESSLSKEPLISGIVTFHAEGILAHYTLLGLERLRKHAALEGILVEFVVVLDCADLQTREIVTENPVLQDIDRVLEVCNGDPGLSRNCGIAEARGSYIGIFDGDDYYSANWLVEALRTVRSRIGSVVVHPEYQISFGSIHCIARPVDLDEYPDFPLSSCLAVHPWTACAFGTRQMFLDCPYQPSNVRKSGFGFEDWHWNLELLTLGYRHVSASGTAHYYRRQISSNLMTDIAHGAIIRSGRFFSAGNHWEHKDEMLA